MKEIIINIKEIMNISESAERAFFNWLRAEKIWWRVYIANINHNIIIQEKDMKHVKGNWPEVYITE